MIEAKLKNKLMNSKGIEECKQIIHDHHQDLFKGKLQANWDGSWKVKTAD